MKNKAERTPRDRNEKRRLLLNKKNAKEIIAKDSNENRLYDIKTNATRSGASALTLKLQGLNRRVLAVVLAVVMILGLLPLGWFSLHGKAEDEQQGLLHVTMNVRANGANNYTTVDIAPGNISENVATAKFKNDLPANAQYYKSVMKDNNTGTETEIKAVSKLKDGSGNEKTYYAIDENATTGTLLKNGQELVLVMAAKYLVSVSAASQEHGDVTTSAITDSETSNFVWGGTDLRVLVAPHTDYIASSVTYIVNGQSRTVAIHNNTATIPANDITNDIDINVNYNRVSAYNIYEVQNLSSSKYYPDLVGIGNHGEITDGDEHTATKDGADPVEPGQTATFYIYSESNTGGSDFVFNMLSINGVDIDYPSVLYDSKTTPFHGGEVTVTFAKAKVAMDFKGETSDAIIGSRKRSLYKVEITNVHEDLEVAFNFKENTNREIIIKGLRGIQQTASTTETRGASRYMHTDGSINDSNGVFELTMAIGTRNYRLTKSNNNIYTAYYNQDVGGDWSGTIPSNNIYFYRVKPGYNPYSVKGSNVQAKYYDNSGNITADLSGSELLAGDNDAADRPDIVIQKASVAVSEEARAAVERDWANWPEWFRNIISHVYERMSAFDSEIRFWGQSSILTTGDTTQRKDSSDGFFDSARDLALTTIAKEEAADPTVRWYAVPLKQNESNNQQLYLNAVPFNYSLQLDTLEVNDVTFSTPSGYTAPTSHTYLETAKHTVEDAQAYLVTPSNVPSRTGYVFGGWQLDLLNAYGEASGSKIYQSNEQVPLSNEVLMSATGDPTTGNDMIIPLKAVWQPIAEADTTKVRSTVYYQDITPKGTSATLDDKVYNVEFQSVETQTTDEYVAFLDTHEPASSKYYTLNVGSHLEGYVRAQQAENQYNEYTAIYDLKFVDLSLEKVVNGNISASAFEIKLKLTRPADYPEDISNNDIVSYVTYENTVSGDDKQVSVVAPANEDVITYTKTFHNGDKVEFTNLPYGWAYEVVETKTQSDNFDTIIATEGKVSHARDSVDAASYTGTLEENMAVTVNNQRAFDDPNVVSDKWLEKDANGTYKLTMETYATGKDVADEDAEVVPLDIALVIDQSGSMGTEDMNPTYSEAAIPDGGWTINNVLKQTYFVERIVDGETKYYPVQAEEGVLYEQIPNDVYIQRMKGSGHDTTLFNMGSSASELLQNIRNGTVISAGVYFNVPTDYYTIGTDNKAHKVFLITVSENLQYQAYAYYFTDKSYEEDEIENVRINWARWLHWKAEDLYKTANKTTFTNEGGTIDPGWLSDDYIDGPYIAWHSNHDSLLGIPIGDYEGSSYWRNLAKTGKVNFVGRTGATITDANAVAKTYSWISNGGTVSKNNLYLPKDGNTYNRLYYIDDAGEKSYIGDTIYTESQNPVASGERLFTVAGESRLSVLQKAVTNFTQEVANNARDTGAEHRIALIGFAGNKYPAISSGNTAYNGATTEYDYTDTGLFVNKTFVNYQTIESLNATTTLYTNLHYYDSSGLSNGVPTGTPVIYSEGKWHRLGSTTTYSGTFYEPHYQDLQSDDYQGALVSASQKVGEQFNGIINDNLADAIDNFGYYGGTYTSYGMAMANNLFNTQKYGYDGTFVDSQGNTQQRKRVIVVFTDGEPGANGYSEAIAGEALADGNRAKYSSSDGGTDATIYTIGLFPGNASQDATAFMNYLSSKYTMPMSKVYGSKGGTTNGSGSIIPGNAISSDGTTNLDGNDIYYYVGDDGKTYSVSTMYQGLPTLGWWNKTETGYKDYIPEYLNGTGPDGRDGIKRFYDINGNAVSEENVDTSKIYFTSNTQRDASTALKYEYRWYDSNNKIRDPIKQTYGQYDTERNTYQFFKMDKSAATQRSDAQYYYPVSKTEELESAFAAAFQTIKATNLGNTMTLTDKTSFIKDAISEDFEWVGTEANDIKLYLVPGTKDNNTGVIDFGNDVGRAVTDSDGITAKWSNDEQAFIVNGFDFSKTYIDQNNNDPKANQKLRIVVTGLKPKAESTGGEFDSNLKESGVFKQEWDEDAGEAVDGSQKLLDAFPMPSITRYKYTIDVNGADKSATHATAFKLLDSAGQSIGNKSYSDLNHDAGNPSSWGNGTAQNVDGSHPRSIILEQINDVQQFETRLSDNKFKHSDGIPDDYQVRYTVTGNGMNTDAYTFTKSIDGGASSDYEDEDNETDGVNFTRLMSKDNDTTVDISSEEETVLVNIQEITQAMDPANDYSDPTKEFDVLIKLLDRNHQPAGEYTSGSYTFDEDGKMHQQMKHNDSITFEIPKGYSLAIDVVGDQGGYIDSYRENGVDQDGDAYTSNPINAYTSIQVINKNDAPTVTGFLDNEKSFGIILGIAAGVSVVAAAAYLYIRRRRQVQS